MRVPNSLLARMIAFGPLFTGLIIESIQQSVDASTARNEVGGEICQCAPIQSADHARRQPRSGSKRIRHSPVSEPAQISFSESDVMAVFVENRAADLVAERRFVDAAIIATRVAQYAQTVDVDHVGERSPVVNAPVNQRNSRIKTKQVRAMSNARSPHHIARWVVFDYERHFVHEIAHLLR
jgi:hypothetical protein